MVSLGDGRGDRPDVDDGLDGGLEAAIFAMEVIGPTGEVATSFVSGEAACGLASTNSEGSSIALDF